MNRPRRGSGAGRPRRPRSRAAAWAGLGGLVVLSLAALAAPGTSAAPPAHPFAVGITLDAAPLIGSAPLLVALESTVTPAIAANFSWTFGDGSNWTESGVATSSTTHVYLVAGTFEVRVVATSANGSANASVEVQVANRPLAASFATSATVGTAPFTVNFSADPLGGTGTFPSITWAFGDGGVGSGPTVAYTYRVPGHYLANLTVTDSANQTASAGTWITVEADASPATSSPSVGGTTASDLPILVGVIVLVIAALGLGLWLAVRPAPGSAPPRPAPTSSPPAPPAPPEFAGAPDPSLEVATPIPSEPVADSDSIALAPRLLLHLYSLGRWSYDDVAGPERNQAGIASHLELRQTAVSRVLRQLVDGGALEVRTGHVRGSGRRLKVYALTPSGERLASHLRRGPDDASRPIPTPRFQVGADVRSDS